MKNIPLNNLNQINQDNLFIGVGLIFFLLFFKIIFKKHYQSLLNFKQFLAIKQQSSQLLFMVYIFFSFIGSYFLLFIFKDNNYIETNAVKDFFLIAANFFLMFFIKSITYTILWYILKFNQTNIDSFLNINSYFICLKIFFLTFCFFFFYFSPFSKDILLIGIILGTALLVVFANVFLFIGLKANGAYTLHIPLYLFLIEVFPLLYLFKTVNTFL